MRDKPAFVPTCSLCGESVRLEECKTDGDGRAVHESCYTGEVCTLQMPEGAATIIRCPYCRVESEFRTLLERVEGWLQCDSCGHNAMPLDPEFQCTCSKCEASHSPKIPDSY